MGQIISLRRRRVGRARDARCGLLARIALQSASDKLGDREDNPDEHVEAEQNAQTAGRVKLRNSTTVFLVGNIEPTMEWYKQLGSESEYYPQGFAILRRDNIEIFLQQQPGYVAPEAPGRRQRHAWNVYIVTDDVKALYAEYSALPGVKIARRTAL